jgi:cobaltochelatase CobN
MKPFSLCYYSATAMEIPCLSEGVRRYRAGGGAIEVCARTQPQLGDAASRTAFFEQAAAADALIIGLHGGKASFPGFSDLFRALAGRTPPYVHIQPTGGDVDSLEAARDHSSDFGTPDWDAVKRYLDHGGPVNFHQLLIYLHNRICGGRAACRPAEAPPHEGIYHPDIEGVPSLEDYLTARVDPSRPTVGLWFYQIYWLNHNLAFIDAIIRAVEARGANVIAVFHLRYKDADLGNRGADYVARHFFMDGRRARIQVLINPLMFSLTLVAPDYGRILPDLDVPFIQALTCSASRSQWQASPQGLPAMDVAYTAAQPEFDGALITVPVACREQETRDPVTGARPAATVPIAERVDKMVRLALNWARLRRTPTAERRVAVVFHHYPPRNDRIGGAVGLDSFASVKRLLDRMQADGYRIDRTYADGDELAGELLERLTCDQRWLPADRMAARAEAHAGPEHYGPWHAGLPDNVRRQMTAAWGEPPGELFVHAGRMHFAGLLNGNVFVTVQPARGHLENLESSYHDPLRPPPHPYLAHYRWIRDVFGAHAVVHVGKHGTLEWLPGKALGLSRECFPDLAIMDLPNLYPYIINDPGEGTQAKRRSYACLVDHLTPALTNADLYDDLDRIEALIHDYRAAAAEDPGKLAVLRSMIWEAVAAANLDRDLKIAAAPAEEAFEAFLERLHAYLRELADTTINDGLHVLGAPPEAERLTEFLVQLTRLPNGPVPSLREALVTAMGFDYDAVAAGKGRRHSGGRSGAEILQQAHARALDLVRRLAQADFRPRSAEHIVRAVLGRPAARVASALGYIADFLVPAIRQCRQEIDFSLRGLSGGFVPPGPSGAPSRGQADILPTGRNFYSVDPAKIPSPAAWQVGVRLGDALIERYLEETGRYPESIGILVYGTTTMRTRGDDVAEILYLMGLKPVWQEGSGRVAGLAVIPAAELKRHRLDVVPRISGFFRDSFPNLIDLLDEAVRTVAALNEPPQSNYLRRNVYRDFDVYRRSGMDAAAAFREATFRIFGCPPGTYGAGVAELVESKQWKSRRDLGEAYIRLSSHAYGDGSYGRQKPETFRRLLARMEVTVKNEDSREYDMLACTDYYNYYGGLIAAAATVRGDLPFAVMGDSADPRRVQIRTTAEEARHVLRARLVNPKWLAGLQRHGYKGAGDISHMMDVVLGWDATADVIDDWMYAQIARAYALNPEMQQWMKQVNPFALQNILEKLLEAAARGMWHADPDTEARLRDAYLEMEGQIEEWTD